MKLFVAKLPQNVTSERLKAMFETYGNVIDAKVITDRDTGMSKCYGFVEMSSEEGGKEAIENLNGYVLKYAGDAVIAFFPSGFNKYLTCDNTFRCAESMINIIKDGINPILSKHDYPSLSVKIGIDEGENIVFQYGYDKSSQVDILGYTMNVTSKITSITSPNRISVGENVYKLLHPQIQTNFKQVNFDNNDWKYIDIKTGNPYKVYTLK